jgi:hypothetical protein
MKQSDTHYGMDLTTEEAYLLRIYAEPSLMSGVSHAKTILKNDTRMTAQEKKEVEAHLTLATKLKKLPE